ncbi:MAG: GNAT family N-acetyltransferase [Pseudomonadota bacterium]
MDLVSPAAYTVAEAAHQPGGHVWGGWAGDTLVGLFGMIDVRVPDPGDDDPDPDPPEDTVYFWRLMVDARHQGNGYGIAMMAEAERIARHWGFGNMSLTAIDRPGGTIPFYEKLGFRRTGRVLWDGEHELIRALG